MVIIGAAFLMVGCAGYGEEMEKKTKIILTVSVAVFTLALAAFIWLNGLMLADKMSPVAGRYIAGMFVCLFFQVAGLAGIIWVRVSRRKYR